MSTWTLVPVRGLASGKSRLAQVLSSGERRSLNALLLARSLDAIQKCAGARSGTTNGAPKQERESAAADVAGQVTLHRCIVVSADTDALELARSRGAQALHEGAQTGLNAALELARETALANGADRLLVLAADLPDVDAEALAKLLCAVPAGAAAVVADKTESGTNGLLLPATAAMRFAFGADSLERHRTALEALGIDTRIWHASALAFDLDTPADYAFWKSPRATVA